MGKVKVAIVFVLLALVGIGVFFGLGPKPFMIMAYDGPTAQLSEVQHNYNVQEVVTPSYAAISPAGITTGLRIEINSAPLVKSQEKIDTASRTYEEGDKIVNKSVDVYKVKCVMGMTVTTTNDAGILPIQNVVFKIVVTENHDSVFTGADESTAYVLEVYTNSIPSIVGEIDITPIAQGYTFPTTAVETVPVPDWILDAGYTGALSDWKKVSFEVPVHFALNTIGLLDITPATATFEIGIDLLLFGGWEQVSTKPDWEIPDFWKTVFETIGRFLWFFGGFILSALAIWKLKGRALIAGLVCIWVLVLWMSGVLPEWLKELGVLGV